MLVNLDYVRSDVLEDAMTGGGSSAAQVWEAGMYHVTAPDSFAENIERQGAGASFISCRRQRTTSQHLCTDNRPLRFECFSWADFVTLSKRSLSIRFLFNSFLDGSFHTIFISIH